MGTVSSVDEATLAQSLVALQQDLEALKKQRNLRSLIGVVGFVVIMVIVGMFMFRLHNYAVNYPVPELTKALGKETEALLDAPETLALADTFRQRAMQVLLPSVVKKFEADAPRFNAEAQQVVNDLQNYLTHEISQRASRQLASTLQQVHAELLKSYGQLPVEQIQLASTQAQQEYLQQLEQTLNRHLQKSSSNLQALQNSLTALEQSPAAMAMVNKTPEALQNDLYAAVLELALYSIKPERGAVIPAHKAIATH